MDDAVITGDDGRARCWWCGDDPAYVAYHDTEWGVPVHDDRRLFEKLCLEGFQAGLSWLTILRKRDRFREVFAGFDPDVVAGFGPDDVARLMSDTGIVRNRAKIEATITNARAYLDLVDAEGSLDAYVWRYAPATRPVPRTVGDIPATSPESVAMSKDLKKRGWAFVGPTTVYAFQQAMGLVDDHLAGCWRRVV
ncbi:MAG TPA: DNA-3-methyladenine glycosylase I [Egicoccus sp.]|nr:DNA-3-methyladenine glycosylase I [Egicoccus sp.]HSK24888.1 DNA-3-methyladenine glycosylase I [Egicoccus sp.]